jgi:N-acetylglucosaminyldiphosphoundecaprenol N-acetyl-beta-D-mannosaminyltransferase
MNGQQKFQAEAIRMTDMISAPEIKLMGIKVHPLKEEELFLSMQRIIHAGGKSIVANVNVNALNLARSRPWFKDFINKADIVFCDGWGVMLGAKFLKLPEIPERITYADWMWALAAFAESKDFSLFFLGGQPGVTDRAAQKLRDRFPRLNVKGLHHGYFEKSKNSPQNKDIIRLINENHPNILVVGFGMPLQEKWIRENWECLDVNIALPGGAVFDYVSETLRRPPRWMVENGLEWLGRLMIEPKRLWKRYIIGNLQFLWHLTLEKLK